MRKILTKQQNLMKNKQGLQFRNAFFALIVIGMVVTAFGVIISEWNTKYEAGLTYNLGNFDQSSQISSTVEGYEGTIAPKTPDVGNDFQSNTLQAGYGIITNLLSPFRVVFGQNGMLDAIAQLAGIPDYVIRPIVTMMILAIIFAIVAIIFRQFRTTT